jgi:uncharacterized protein YbjT (DUF2867 family)
MRDQRTLPVSRKNQIASDRLKILVVGASGNLGSHFTRRLLTQAYDLRLLRHQSAVPFDSGPNCEIVDGDLDNPASLRGVCNRVDCVVYVAGVLFRPRPASFLRRRIRSTHKT